MNKIKEMNMETATNNLIQVIEIENFYSVRDKVTIDFRAENINTAKERELKNNIFMWNNKTYLKTIGLFGPNAAGKTNIIFAIRLCCRFILQQLKNMNAESNIFPTFRFQNYKDKPSTFRTLFVAENIEYEYTFSVLHNRVINEELHLTSDYNRKNKVFTRTYIQEKNSYQYSFATSLPKDTTLFLKITAPNQLFLSQANTMQQAWAIPVYNFFNLHFLLGIYTTDVALQPDVVDKYKPQLLKMLHFCDSDIQDIQVIKQTLMPDTSNLPEQFAKQLRPAEVRQVFTVHSVDPHIPFILGEESKGTQQLITMLLTLIPTLKHNKALLLDEFDLNMHTRMTHFIFDAINATQSSQFLFSSHDTTLISMDLFRRDQIYFVEKDKEQGCTSISRLIDKKDFRETMDASKRYIAGHFGAVPNIESAQQAQCIIRKILYND